ncbi:MAG: SDR family oxidoreductase [Williamsia sp.]|nr:SDR family oxidoreductase [Williamsia sp.]
MPTVLILGATSDMAVAIAKKFASKGYSIQLAARNGSDLQSMQSDIAIRYQVPCSVHAFDAVRFDTHALFFEQLQPKPDVTICVFGYLGENDRARIDWQEASRIIHTNYTGAVSILNIISNHYALRKSGVIAGISSVAGERGRQSNYIYGSAKAGFTAYLSGLRNKLVKENVHVLTVLPGFAYTRMTEGLKLPKPLTAQPAEIGEAVYTAIQRKTNIIWVRWMWRWIMLIIKLVPEAIFKNLKL